MPGNSSSSNSSRFCASSGNVTRRPVTLPPGRAKLAAHLSATGSPPDTATIGTREVAWRAAAASGPGAAGDDHVDLGGDELDGKRREPGRVAIGVAPFDDNVAPVDITEVAQALR